MRLYGLELVPYKSPSLDDWRDSTKGITSVHQDTNLELYGAIDDLWVDPAGELSVVDYKATSTAAEISLRDAKFDRYKRQLEMYQWLLKRNDLRLSQTAYLLFANADRSRESFDRKLDFAYTLLPYMGDDHWVEPALIDAKAALDADMLPPSTEGCVWCGYRKAVVHAESGANVG